MRESRLEQLERLAKKETTVVKLEGLEGLFARLLGGPPLPTQKKIYFCKDEYIAYMGAAGAAKTSLACALGWFRGLTIPGYRLIVARQDENKLKETTLKRMEEMLKRLPDGTLVERSQKSPETWYINPIGGIGAGVSQITFLGLNAGLGSLEAHGIIVDEADEVDETTMGTLKLRARLPGIGGLFLVVFNPPDEDHYLYRDCTGLDEHGRPVLDEETGQPKGPIYTLFVPEPKENAANVKKGYYEERARQLTPDLRRRYIEGKWGSTLKGTPVYGHSFRRDFHVAKHPLKFRPTDGPLYRFHDFGFHNPFTFYAQKKPFGGLRVLAELNGSDVEIHERAPEILSFTKEKFMEAKEVADIGDPAAYQQKDTGATSAVLIRNGIFLRPAPNDIDGGIRTVRMLLSRNIGGEPALEIDPSCTVLIRTLERGYRYPKDTRRNSDSPQKAGALKPLKDGIYDHPADAFRYGVVYLFGIHGQVMAQDPEGMPVDYTALGSGGTTSYAGDPLMRPCSIAYRPEADPMNAHRRY